MALRKMLEKFDEPLPEVDGSKRKVSQEEGETPGLFQAREVAKRTKELLATRGWCLWECNTLNEDIIVVTRDELIDGYPQIYPIYTQAELELLSNTGEFTKLLVHEAKKITRATVVNIKTEHAKWINH